MSTPNGGVTFNNPAQARSTLQNSKFVDRSRFHPALPFAAYPLVTTPSGGLGITVLITGEADAYGLYPGLMSHVNIETSPLEWYELYELYEIDESCTVMPRNSDEILVVGRRYHGELVGVLAGTDDIPVGSPLPGCPSGHEGELLFVASPGSYVNTEMGTGTGDDPEIVVMLSDCVGGVRVVVYAKLEIINGGGKLRINPYSYRTEEQCCCADPVGTSETGTAGTGDPGTAGTSSSGGTSATCGYALSSVLFASLSNGYGSITLTWNGSYWVGNKALGCGETMYLRYSASDTLEYSCNGSTWANAAMLGSVQCTPTYSATFLADQRAGSGACTALCPPLIITITE